MNMPPSTEMNVRAAALSRRSLIKLAMAIGAAGSAGSIFSSSASSQTSASTMDADAQQRTPKPMKYILSWNERSQGSPIEYENAQKRILEVFTQWKAPANFKIEMFVIRVGDWGGYMLLDCDDPLAVHKFCSMLPAFVFEARPVVPVMDAVRVELEAIAFRDGLKGK
jgi:muconolactone delta-isomerase